MGRVGAGTGLAPIHTHSTVSFTLKDVLIGVRCGIILGEKTPPLSLMVLWLKEPSFLSSSACILSESRLTLQFQVKVV
jgi:hypothetical protein